MFLVFSKKTKVALAVGSVLLMDKEKRRKLVWVKKLLQKRDCNKWKANFKVTKNK